MDDDRPPPEWHGTEERWRKLQAAARTWRDSPVGIALRREFAAILRPVQEAVKAATEPLRAALGPFATLQKRLLGPETFLGHILAADRLAPGFFRLYLERIVALRGRTRDSGHWSVPSEKREELVSRFLQANEAGEIVPRGERAWYDTHLWPASGVPYNTFRQWPEYREARKRRQTPSR